MKSNVKRTIKPLIIGYGNPLRGDDAFGHVIVAQLQTQFDASRAEIMGCQQLTLDLAEDITQASKVILIDAAVKGVPGTILKQAVKPSLYVSHTLEHHMTPVALITAVYVLYNHLPSVMLVSVVGQHWDTGADLSNPVKASMQDAVATVVNLLE